MLLVNLNGVLLKIKLKAKFFLISLFLLVFLSCKDDGKLEREINAVPIDFKLERFDLNFAKATEQSLPQLKSDYPYLFPVQVPDSIWMAKLTDTLQLELQREVADTFEDFEEEGEALESLFKHIRYYFPDFDTPKTVTLISDVQYDTRVVLTDEFLLIGLDNYLGATHRFYAGLPNYVAQQLDKAYLTSDVASAFAKKANTYPRSRTFLSRMIYYGKELYLKDLLLPNTADYQRINYTQEELEWANDNEEQIWRYFIEKELLYDTGVELDRRFLDPAPFSKFQLELDSESPGRIGRYIGWQIVRAYANNTSKIALVELLDMPAEEIFKQSNYKPKR